MKKLFERLFHKNEHILVNYSTVTKGDKEFKAAIYKVVDIDGKTKEMYINVPDWHYLDTRKIQLCPQAYERDGLLIMK